MANDRYGSQIREAREALELSMSELARRAGVTQPTVANWEARERDGRITLATLARAAAALDAEFSYTLTPPRLGAPTKVLGAKAPKVRRAVITRTTAPQRSDPNDIWL